MSKLEIEKQGVVNIGSIIWGSSRDFTVSGGWARNLTYNIGSTIPKGTYVISIFIGNSAGITGDIFITTLGFSGGVSRANAGNVYTTSAGTIFYTFSSDTSSFKIDLYSNAVFTASVRFCFLRVA